MAITIPIDVQIAPTFQINTDVLKQKLTKYAELIIRSMAAEKAEDVSVSLHRTSPFIDSLKLEGGRPVPKNIKMEDIYEC